ncbi:MAG: haloacid dehalogenase type II [Pseudomonadota bacterium]
MTITTCIFDAYGTLFDVGAAAREASKETQALKEIWPKLAADWRMKQLQYTWLRAVAGTHVDFWRVTQDGLDWAMEAAGLDDADLRQSLLDLYWALSPYPEVPATLTALKAQGKRNGILSNGTPEMLDAAVSSAGIGADIYAILSVEAVGVFKPARAVYDLVGARFKSPAHEVAFISSNGWDAAHAAAYGFLTIWVNRAGEPLDRLPGRPAHILPDLTSLPELLA